MDDTDLEHRIERLEHKLAAARWRTAAAAGIATVVVGLACKPALPDKIKLGDVELDSSGLHIGAVALTKYGLAIGETRLDRNRFSMSEGESTLFVEVGDRPQLTVKHKAFSVDLVAGDDFASVTAASGGSDFQTLSTLHAAAPATAR